MRARLFAAVIVPAALVVLAVPLGRWEHARERSHQANAMRALVALTGADLRTGLSGTRLATSFDCLLYRSGKDLYGFELCFTSDGHLVEAIDRRGSTPVFWSFRDEPEAAPVRVAVPTLIACFHRAGALESVPSTASALPVGFADIGAVSVPKKQRKKHP